MPSTTETNTSGCLHESIPSGLTNATLGFGASDVTAGLAPGSCHSFGVIKA
jgi:hypothetical protein